MSVITGKGAKIDGVACTRRFRIQRFADIPDVICSATDGAPVRAQGNSDWRGRYVAIGATPVRLPGDTFTFTGATREGKGWTGDAIADRAIIVWDQRRGLYLHHFVDFSGNGALSESTKLDPTDDSKPSPVHSAGLNLYLDNTRQDEIQEIRLVIQCGNADYVSSTTDGVTKRAAGNIEAFLLYEQLIADPSTLPDENAIKTVKIDTGSSTQWKVNYFRFLMAQTRVVIENDARQKGVLTRAFLRAAFTGWKADDKGYIKKPDGTNVWPET